MGRAGFERIFFSKKLFKARRCSEFHLRSLSRSLFYSNTLWRQYIEYVVNPESEDMSMSWNALTTVVTSLNHIYCFRV